MRAREASSRLPETLFLPLSSDMTFRIAPEAGYDVRDVLVDGVGLGEISEYTFQNLRAHTHHRGPVREA
jgi:penicillin-binding protein 1A